MKILLFTLMFFYMVGYSQELTAHQINHISTYEFESLDELMVQKHNFIRVKDFEEEHQKVYTNDSEHLDKLMVITVIKDIKGCSNVISIVNKSEVGVLKFIEELPKAGFAYQGKKKISEDVFASKFMKDKTTVLVSDTITNTGAYQILIMCR
ncbi:hypothetical protein [Chryseobacterium gambrini]|uniref:hypothetical protein n=1 Tax=Chryseobacterium gambrini TaxID=373672 RepID=UPI0022F3D464|nr:hypothetical protein [Chryseobacterium gambrini]WBX97822.1 hypothetical protein PE065_00890 [Chryseobacterium gambrini]